MANAIILNGGRVVQATNLTNVLFDYRTGFANSFVLNGKKYAHCYPSDFRNDDQGKKPNGGYYEELRFLEYSVRKITLDQILTAYSLKYNDLSDAVLNDNIVSHKLYLPPPPYSDFCKFSNYSWRYDPKVLPIDGDGNIIFPTGTQPTSSVSLSPFALAFYAKNIALVNSNDFLDNKDQGAFYLALCALDINMINRDVFPMFNQSAELVGYVSNQNAEWTNGTIFIQPTLDDFKQYELNLTDYYDAAYSNQVLINDALPDTKIFWLANALSVTGLSVFPPDEKINILIEAIDTQMVSSTLNDEDFLVKVVQSVGLVPSQINFFLDQLISKSNIFDDTLDGKITLFEAIYKNVADNRTGRYLPIYNLPPDRKIFIETLYNLWLNSKYNPYFDDPSYTQPADPLGFFPESYFMTETGRQNYHNDTASPVIVYSTSQGELIDYTSSFEYSLNGYNIKVVNVKNSVNKSIPDLSLVGNYLIYQPVVLIGYKSDTDISLPPLCYIPLFYLYYADAYKSTKDFDFGVLALQSLLLNYLLFDAPQSISWIKGLSSLFNATDTQKVLLVWAAVAGVNAALEVTAGPIIGLALYVANTSTDPDIAKFKDSINIFLGFFVIATVSLNILTKQRLIMAADNVILEQQNLLSLGKPVELQPGAIDPIVALAGNKDILVDLMNTKVNNLNLTNVSTKFGAFSLTRKFDFFRDFYNLNDIDSWNELNRLISTNFDSTKTYNLIDIWDQDISVLLAQRSKIIFLKSYGYMIYQEKDVWEHLDTIKLSPKWGSTTPARFNPIGGHTSGNFLQISSLSDLDPTINVIDNKWLIIDPNIPGLPPQMQLHKATPFGDGHIYHENLWAYKKGATVASNKNEEILFQGLVFKKIVEKTQINHLWLEAKIKEEFALALSNKKPFGPPVTTPPDYGSTQPLTTDNFRGKFSDKTVVKIKFNNYYYQNGKNYSNYISYMEIKR